MTETTNIAVEAKNATKQFGEGETSVTALDKVSVTFEKGRFTAIMGPSGSGKSTLLNCMAGLESLTDGDVYISGKDISNMSDRDLTELRRDSLGFIFQSFNLIPTLNAYENITLPTKLAGKPIDEEWVNKVVSTLGISERLSHRPTELSGGQQQRVAAGRAFANKPQVVFADEPTGNLDSRAGNELLEFMRQAVDNLGQTIIMVTHDPGAASHADRVVFLGDGRVVDEISEPKAEAVFERMKALGS